MTDTDLLVNSYFSTADKIYEHCGYRRDWVSIPLDDARGYYWRIVDSETVGGAVRFHENKFNIENKECVELGSYYQDDIYGERFSLKCVYRGEHVTLVCCDTHTDGNKFLRIFDNAKELPPAAADNDDDEVNWP